jgi:flagellar protein FliJ
MSALQPLMTLLDHASAQRDQLLAAHQRAQAAVRAAEQQTEGLREHRRQTMQRSTEQFRQPGGVQLMQCYHGFMDRLDEAVAQQARQLVLAQERSTAAQAKLVAAEQRVAAVRKLIEGRTAEADRARDRHDQKQTDESASRAAWQRLSARQDLAADSPGFSAA